VVKYRPNGDTEEDIFEVLAENYGQKTKKSSRYTGVAYDFRDQVWRAYLYIGRKLVQLGSFATEEEAWEMRQTALANRPATPSRDKDRL